MRNTPLNLLVVATAALAAAGCASTRNRTLPVVLRPPVVGPVTHELPIAVRFSTDFGGGGQLTGPLRFTSLDLCRAARSAIMSSPLKDADGELGDCAEVGR